MAESNEEAFQPAISLATHPERLCIVRFIGECQQALMRP